MLLFYCERLELQGPGGWGGGVASWKAPCDWFLLFSAGAHSRKWKSWVWNAKIKDGNCSESQSCEKEADWTRRRSRVKTHVAVNRTLAWKTEVFCSWKRIRTKDVKILSTVKTKTSNLLKHFRRRKRRKTRGNTSRQRWAKDALQCLNNPKWF